MLTFLNTGFLIALGAIALPLLIHLLNRQKVRKMAFSTLVFLKRLQQRKMKRLRMRQWLLLLLRTAILAFFVLAFTRPTLKVGTPIYGAKVRTSAVLLLDNSLSMGLDSELGSLYERAKAVALELLELFENGDEIFLLLAGSGQEAQFEKSLLSVERVRELIGESQVTYQRVDLWEALKAAIRRLQEASHPNREIYIISDFQKSGFQPRSDSLLANFQGRLFLLPIRSEEKRNVGIISSKVNTQIIEVNQPVQLEVTVKNYGKEEARDVLLQVYLDGQRVAQRTVDLPAGGAASELFAFVPERKGTLSGWVVLEEDPLRADNRYYFALDVPGKRRVLLLGLPELRRFVEMALQPTREEALWDITAVPSDRELNRPLSEFHAVVLVDCPSLDDAFIDRLRYYVKEGGGIIIFPGDQSDLRFYNDHLLSRLDLPLFARTRGQLARPGLARSGLAPSGLRGKVAYSLIGWLDRQHPIFQGVFKDPTGEIDSPLFYLTLDLLPKKGVREVIRYEDDRPFLVEYTLGRGRILLFTSGLSPGWSNLPVKALFAPLVHRAVSYVASGSHWTALQARVGEMLELRTQEAGQEFYVLKPDEEKVALRPTPYGSRLLLSFRDTDVPGLYRLFAGKREIAYGVVNCDPRESELEQASLKDVKEVVGGAVYVAQEGKNLQQLVSQLRFGRELTPYFLYAALLFLIGEMLLSRVGSRKEAIEESRESEEE